VTHVLPEATTKYEKAQRVLVGHLLMYPSAAPDVFEGAENGLGPAFSSTTLRDVIEAMERLYRRGAEISQQGVISEVERVGRLTASLVMVFAACLDAADEEYRVRELGSSVADYMRQLRDGHHFEIIKEKMRRASSFPDVLEIAEKAISLDAGNRREYQRAIGDVIDELVDTQKAISQGRRRPGYSWGLPKLDEVMPIRPGNLYTIAGPKASAKSKSLLSVIDHNLSDPDGAVPCLLLSLEMSDVEVIKCLASRRAEVDSSLIFSRALPGPLFADIKLALERVRRSPLEIDSSPALSVRDIVSRIRHWKIKNGVPDGTGIVGVDFLQLVTLDREGGRISEATALKNVAYTLAEAAKTMNVSILAAAQLNKQADGAKPQIGYIEGSGGLAQASHGVLLLDLVRLRDGNCARSADGLDDFNIIVAKNRDGESMVTIPCKVDLSIGKFYDGTPAQLRLIK
jgi:replicative DNA helicase